MAFAAMLLSQVLSPFSWTSAHMDLILELGDQLYHEVPHKHTYVEYTELPQKICVTSFQRQFNSEAVAILCGYLGSRDSSGQLYSLEDASAMACQSGAGYLLISCSYTISVFNVDDCFFLFDSHSRGQDGLPAPDGTAVLMKFDSVPDVSKHIRRLYRGNMHAQFDIVCFSLSLSPVPSQSATSAAKVVPPQECRSVPVPTDNQQPGRTLRVSLKDGRLLNIFLPTKTTQPSSAKISDEAKHSSHSDKVQNYALLAMEFGFVLKNFLGCIKTPNRQRMLRTVKLMMILLKADSYQSKYADEILRFLVHQLCILSEEEANLMFYSMFVNTKGDVDSFVPCDLMMEFMVRAVKKHIKHMHSNKTESNIDRKTGALASLNSLVKTYDNDTGVLQRSKKHTKSSQESDELSMAEDLHSLKPFTADTGRAHSHFKNVQPSMLGLLDYDYFLKWVTYRSKVHATSLGNWYVHVIVSSKGIILCMETLNEKCPLLCKLYSLKLSLIGWVHTQNDPCNLMKFF